MLDEARWRDHDATMITKIATLALAAACGVLQPDSPDQAPPPPPDEGQAFCCISVNSKNMTGEGCGAISQEQINSCVKVLHCGGNYTKDDGKVTCE
jgi:hypothetical protein